MFSRKRANSNPPVKTPPSSAASTAAVQAFLANRASNASLSNAAATAALRSYTTSPVPVGQIQTKRMAQRRGSMSSNGSASGTAPYPGRLQRQNSSGSMTERSFRDPSPNRISSSGPHRDDPPPVPALPRDYMPHSVLATRRAASVEPRISSPIPRASVSVDQGPGGMPPKSKRITSPPSVGELGRGQARDSVNFSRPMSPHNSPPASPFSDRRAGPLAELSVPTSPRSTGGRTPGLHDGEVERFSTPSRPVKKGGKDIAEGSHFARGSSGGRPIGTALDTTPPRQPPSNSSTPSPGDPRLQASQVSDDARISPKRKKKRNVPSASNEDQEGGERPPSSYASDSDTQSERSDRARTYNTRPAGLLVKQPSIVREEPESEDQEVQIPPTENLNGRLLQNDTAAKNAIPSSRVIAGRQLHSRSASQPKATLATNKASSLGVPAAISATGAEHPLSSTGAVRHQSPSGRARFSSQPPFEIPPGGIQRSPPGRKASPAKPAIKSSSRGPSPVGSVQTSVISDEDFKGASGKKKVSFEQDSVAIGRAASPESQNSPVLMSPQNKEATSKWFNKREETGPSKDSAIQPTPALPSFGSVRERKYETGRDEPFNASDPKQAQSTNRYETSSDLVIGNVLAQHYREKEQRRSNDPIPSEVMSVDVTGHLPTSENEAFNDIDDKPRASEANVRLANVGNNQSNYSPRPASHKIQETPSSTIGSPIPSIAVLPATPGVESAHAEPKDWFRIPGEFPYSTDSLGEDLPPASSVVQHHATDPTPADVGVAEPKPGPAVNHHEEGHSTVGRVADILRAQIHTHSHEESDDTDDSIYSDAAEDLSDIEGDGFGSINAIVESPANLKPTAYNKEPSDMSKEPPTTTKARPSLTGRSESKLSGPASDKGWDEAQAYWSGLSQTQKQELERAAAPVAPKELKPKTEKKVPQSRVSDHPPLPPWPDKQYRDDVARPATASTMKQSMRSSPPEISPKPNMRSSMRNGRTPKGSRNSVQSFDDPPPGVPSQNRSRPVSAVAMVDYSKAGSKSPANSRRAVSATPVPASTPTSPKGKPVTKTLRRIKSNDSASSYRRSRDTEPDSDRHGMLRTMRGRVADDGQQSRHENRTSIYSARSPSPNGYTRRAAGSMPTSMRGTAGSKKQTRTSSPPLSGFWKSSKSKPASDSRTGNFRRRVYSSDEDSSDDNIRRKSHRSRFDSSDDDGPVGLRPVRGIPGPSRKDDSTDLDDSSPEPSPMIPGIEVNTANDKEKKKRSLFRGLGGKTPDIRSARSPTRQEPPLERPRTARLNTSGSNRPVVSDEASSPKSLKLQRKKPPRLPSNSWPLPEMPADSRPNTSDGVNAGNGTRNGASAGASMRPELGTRRSTVQNENAGSGVNGVMVTGKTGKKKRFPLLRKAFGLTD
ncbi:hypothetical protein MMC07_004216 [Pseudocyphellaria aurata]|nr:hypothetical protein [Pseudocyphellaria aurata]